MGEAIVWWLTLQVLGIVAFPISALVLRSLPDRGWAITKILGLLLTVWLAYIVAMLHLLPFGRALLVLCLLIVAGFSGWLLFRKGRALLREVQNLARDRSFVRYILVAETLFTVAYIAWALVRSYDPTIFGTEKFMDFGFMNSVVKSESFPPNDMWLSGNPINYYYFGYVLMGSLSLLSGVATEIGYNLANVTLFSLTTLGAFGVAFNLASVTVVRKRVQQAARPQSRDAQTTNGKLRKSQERLKTQSVVPAAILDSSLPTRRVHKESRSTTLNVEKASQVARAEKDVNVTNGSEKRYPAVRGEGNEVGGTEILSAPPPVRQRVQLTNAYDSPARITDPDRRGPWFLSPYIFGLLAALMVVGMGHLSTAFAKKDGNQMDGNGWRPCLLCMSGDFNTFWDPSRVIMDYKYAATQPGQPAQKIREQVDPINEFPAFSFILSDMHPHVMALPLWMLMLYFIIALSRRRILRGAGWGDGLPRGPAAWLMIFLVVLVIGALYTTNTWDYPTFLLLTLATLALPYMAFQRRSEKPHGWRWLRPWLVQVVGIAVLSLLVFLPFHLTFKSLVGSQPAELPSNLANIPVIGLMLQKLGGVLAVSSWDKGIVGFLMIFGIFLVSIIGWLAYETGRYFRKRARNESVTVEASVLGGLFVVVLLVAIVLRFPLLALLLPMAALSLYLVWREPEIMDRNLVLITVALTSLIGLAIEVFYLRDVFNARQNTIFKFYYQIWVLWAIAAAYGMWRVLSAIFRRKETAVTTSRRTTFVVEQAPPHVKAAGGVWAGIFAVLVVSGLLYLGYAVTYKIGKPPVLHGLDGTAHLRDSAPGDYAAINWLKQNGTSKDVVLECCRDEYNNPGHAGIVSSYTGIPTLVSWDGHENQWRGGQPQLLAQVGQRRSAVTALYTAKAPDDTAQGMLRTLQQYGIDYIFVGDTERGLGSSVGGHEEDRVTAQAEDLFKQNLTEVFRSGTTVIYGVGKGGVGTTIVSLPTLTPTPQLDLSVPPVSMFTLGAGGVNRGQFSLPRGIARDAQGNFYVVDAGNLRIQKFDSGGKWTSMFGSGKGTGDGQFGMLRDDAVGTGPSGIAVDPSGNVYVADTWNHRVQKFDNTGKFVSSWGSFIDLGDAATAGDADKDRKFYGPRGIASGPNGDVYLTDTGNKRVLIFDSSGAFKRKIDSGMTPGKVAPDYAFQAPGELNEPIGIAIDAQGNVYVADTNNRRIQKFDTLGKPVAQWPVQAGWEPGEFLEPFLTVDTVGNVYVSAPTTKSVLKYDPTGKLIGKKTGQDNATLALPTGMTVDPTGNVYVVDTKGTGVLRLDPSGW